MISNSPRLALSPEFKLFYNAVHDEKVERISYGAPYGNQSASFTVEARPSVVDFVELFLATVSRFEFDDHYIKVMRALTLTIGKFAFDINNSPEYLDELRGFNFTAVGCMYALYQHRRGEVPINDLHDYVKRIKKTFVLPAIEQARERKRISHLKLKLKAGLVERRFEKSKRAKSI